ncbi:pentapeptide repeat-containing protein [Nonomuraea sp. NPDC050451]|uniref:pentapeptide repeat-containing protein n=1 Tax=Nonomuraea sp. NPDC050451 TaxID=3364364 RepID=UPI0037914604
MRLWWIIPAVAAVVVAVGVTAWWLMSGLPPLKGAEAATAQIEIVRTALAAGAGAGAAITLILAFRRQRHHEVVAASTEHDASERRVTELYTKAVEQLGNDQAPVRLGGLYALERLARDTPVLSQTIVDVICAYLRMPYIPPPERGERIRAAQRAARAKDAAHLGVAVGRDPHEELQVRLTAQRTLANLLRYVPAPSRRWLRRCRTEPNPWHWPATRLDLTGATLVDFDLRDCHIGEARFSDATFTGTNWFDGAIFTAPVQFDGATFTGTAGFHRVTFTRTAWFHEAAFTGTTGFEEVTFADTAWFGKVTFAGFTAFSEATFTGTAGFDRANFTDTAVFHGAAFTDTAAFYGATFTGPAGFDRATFTGPARFDQATFTGTTGFEEVTFADAAVFDGAQGLEAAELTGVRLAPVPSEVLRKWPPQWREVPAADGWSTLRLASEEVPDGGQEEEPED